MTENEKRILTLLSKQGPLSKRELSRHGTMGWATVVKMLDRLEETGIVRCVGTGEQPETSGKNPLLYDLADRYPLVVGIDVSYAITHIILSNLKHDILAQYTCPTPQTSDIAELQEFLRSRCAQFLEQALERHEHITGIGVGFPLWLVQGQKVFAGLQQSLEEHFQTIVRIENNVRSYTMYKKWAGKAFALNDFILITIRSGIGAGIFQDGQLIRGTHGMAGELSHLPLQPDGKRCRCGKFGCLETLVNRDILYREYVEQILRNTQKTSGSYVSAQDHQKRSPYLQKSTDADVKQGLAVLFSLAKQGHDEANGIIRDAAKHLGTAIATLLLIFDISHLFLAGTFGPDGDILIPALRQEIDARILPGNEYTITYTPLEHLGFAHGAALLVLEEYFTQL